MEKPADTQYPILEVLKRRWSPRSFSDRMVEPQKIKQLFEAARWAASAFNEQPWRFIIATKDDTSAYNQALGCLVEANQSWAKSAPLIGLTVVSENFERNGKPNRCGEHDLGLAMGNLCAQAMSLDLWVHQMAGIDQDKVRETYQLPEDFRAFSGFAIGYIGEPGVLPEGMRQAETKARTRKAFGDFVFGNKFGEASRLFDS